MVLNNGKDPNFLYKKFYNEINAESTPILWRSGEWSLVLNTDDNLNSNIHEFFPFGSFSNNRQKGKNSRISEFRLSLALSTF